MVGTLAQEVAKAKDHPVQLGTRERKVLEVVNTGINLAVATSAALKQNVLVMGQAVTASGGDAGKITISGMTASGVVVCTPAESLGTNIVLSHVVAGSGIITVFAQDTNASGAAAGIASKAINYIVISK
jgi:hypothetical protein